MTTAPRRESGRDLENEHRIGIAPSIESDVPGNGKRRRRFCRADFSARKG